VTYTIFTSIKQISGKRKRKRKENRHPGPTCQWLTTRGGAVNGGSPPAVDLRPNQRHLRLPLDETRRSTPETLTLLLGNDHAGADGGTAARLAGGLVDLDTDDHKTAAQQRLHNPTNTTERNRLEAKRPNASSACARDGGVEHVGGDAVFRRKRSEIDRFILKIAQASRGDTRTRRKTP
jgi:hypothetical protein